MKKWLGIFVALSLYSSVAFGQLIISEVFEPNGGTAKFVEIHNQGGTAVDLAAGDWELSRFSNANATGTAIDLVGTIPAGGFFVVGDPAVDTLFGAGTLDQSTTAVNHNGNDKYRLIENASTSADIRDSFGGDNIGNSSTFASNVTAFRVGAALPNNGDWGSTTQPGDGGNSTSGNWVVFNITSSNANALTTATPGGAGGAGEVPVELMQFSID